MLSTTVARLRCPRRKGAKGACGSPLKLDARERVELPAGVLEIRSGELKCPQCQAGYPILAGVAVLVEDVRSYLLSHVKGVSQSVPDSALPKGLQREFARAKAELSEEHIEEDLESERVNSLYLMNHYLHARNGTWWKADHGGSSELIDRLIREHWDQGPFARISSWLRSRGQAQAMATATATGRSALELGCGVGGLYGVIHESVGSYLGIDSSFASIALARHYALGMKYAGNTRVPRDLLQGPVSADPQITPAVGCDGRADFVVGDIEAPPVARDWGIAIALNTIDMLDDPAILPRVQLECLAPEGIAIQSCPYVWHARASRKLRKILPKEVRDSASAVEWLYEKQGFRIEERVEHLPWLFFKHARQLEIYSVHLILCRSSSKPGSSPKNTKT